MKKICSLIFITLGLLTSVTPAFASSTINADAAGWINTGGGSNNSGFNSGVIANHFAGFEGQAFNNWFTFALPTLNPGEQFTSATLSLWNDGLNHTIDPLATYSVYQATSFSFAGLQDGPELATISLSDADNGIGHYVNISLNSLALTLLNNNAGNAFTLGGSILSSVDQSQCFDCVGAFGYTGGFPEPTLTLNTSAVPSAVPVPAAVWLFGSGLLGLLGFNRKRT